MDINNTQIGEKVIFSFPNNGYKSHQEQAQKYLVEGREYTINHIDIDNWHTDVFLKEFPRIPFNSVMFSNVEPTNKPKF